jgi:uncharacterized protein (TIGR01319 family)
LAKRTVEGDLGVYVNMKNVVELIGKENLIKELDMDIDYMMENHVPIPKTHEQIKFVERLAKEAVIRATVRHAGQIRNLYGTGGKTTIAEGKDLTEVKYIVGTGGALTRLPNRIKIMESIAKYNTTGTLLFPKEQANILVDNDYIMASLGVLSKKYPEAAFKLLLKSLGIEEEYACTLG